MDDFIVARVLHVLGVVLWIGGVAMVTSTVLPMIRRMPSASDGLEIFRRIEKRFARQARFTTLLVGLSGFYMMHLLDAWDRFAELRFWWMHAMVLVWMIFTVFLFILEPRVLPHQGHGRTLPDPKAMLTRMQRMHWILLGISLITVAGAVAGSHGWLFSGEW
ncbi:hypothetical protein [Nitrosomonas sp. ANs5]|uniref:hypothetical protein n=1 Tax=Nitrosomonas sp. ANs5 TaxID=3423941 RepID=UPI003D34A049